MLYTCCNSSRNTWQRSCGCGCGCGNTVNTTSTSNGHSRGCGTNTFVNGVYGIFFPISNRQCLARRTITFDCGNAGTWTNTTNGNGCGCACRRNLCSTNNSLSVTDGEAYYARQYGLHANDDCGCGSCYSH